MLSILAVCITLASLCQELSEAEIARVINMSKEANFINNGVIDPDKIQIGQTLTFRFQDGTEKRITVEKGDSQWKILKDKIGNLIIAHGQVVPFPKDQAAVEQELTPALPYSAKTDWALLWILLASVSLIAVAIWISRLVRKHKMEAKKDPVTSGPAMRPGGITDENALAYATQVASRQFNNPNLQVREVQKGMLSGENLEVFYAGDVTPQRRTFINQPAYRGIVSINGTDQFVYFLQGCGNDVRVGNFFRGENLQFIVDAQATVLRPTPATTTTEQSTPTQLDPMMQMVTLMTAVLQSKNSGNMIITGVGGLKVEMFFTSGSVLFSANGQHKEVAPAVNAEVS